MFPSKWSAVKWSGCSGRTVPARRPVSTWWSVWSRVMAATFISTNEKDHALADPPARPLGVSYLPQEASVFRKLTVSENIKAVLELQKLSAARNRSSHG
jgi:hypothetical protein